MFCRPACGILAVLLLGCGCLPSVSRQDARDRSEPLLQRARAKAAQGDTESAVRLYTAAIDSNPKLAVAHLDLALVFHDSPKDKDYVRAIYHYQRYLSLRPGTEKQTMIEERIRLARQQLAASIMRPDRYAEDKAALEQENGALKKRVAELEKQLQAAQRETAALQRDLDLRVAAARPPPAALPEPPPPTAPAVSALVTAVAQPRPAAPPPAPASPAVRTYRVKSGDTLSRIATQVYQDSSQWKRIQDANRRTLGDSSRVKVGQVLVIPDAGMRQ